MTYSPDSLPPPARLDEQDRSLPISLPDDRPLTYGEQGQVWRDVVPESLRRGQTPTSLQDARELASIAATAARRWGWALNRLDWDREFPDAHLESYAVPDIARPGAARVPPRRIAKLRQTMYPAPPRAGKLSFRPPYRQDRGTE